MKEKKKRQNKIDAKTCFGLDLSRDYRNRYDIHRIDNKSFFEGEKFALENQDKEIPSEYKNDKSFIFGLFCIGVGMAVP